MKLIVSLSIHAIAKNILDLLQGPTGSLGNDKVDESNGQESTECVNLKISSTLRRINTTYETNHWSKTCTILGLEEIR
jgi:hypothetical protein